MSRENNKEFIFRLKDRTLVIIDWANVYGWFSNPESRSYLGWGVDPKRLFEYLSTYSEITDKRLYHGVEIGNKRSEDFGTEAKNIGFTFIKKEVKWVPVYLNEQNHFKKVVKKLFDVLDKVKTTNSEIATKLYELRTKIENRLADEEPDFDVGDDGQSYVAGASPAYAPEDAALHKSTYDLIEELDGELKKLNDNIVDLQKHLSQPVMRLKCDFDVEIARDVFNLSNDFEHLILFSGDGDFAALADDLISKGKRVTVVFGGEHLGKEYKVRKGLFLCTVNNLRSEISRQNNIPEDFSSGRDSFIVAKDKQKSQ